jgi:hypothetical protein
LVLVTLSLLSLVAFTEGDYTAAEWHAQAIARVAGSRLNRLEFLPFLAIAMADLRMTGIYLRVPLLPYYLHPHAKALSGTARDRSKFFALFNAMCLPHGPEFPFNVNGQGTMMLQKLHELAFVHKSPEHDYMTMMPLIYDAAYHLALLQVELERYGSWAENMVLLAFQMQFWGMCKQFISQSGVQARLFQRFATIVSSMSPTTLSDRWVSTGAGLNFLLWVHCNAFISALHHEKPVDGIAMVPSWLLYQLQHVFVRLEMTSPEVFQGRLKEFPYVEHWNGVTSDFIYPCLETRHPRFENASHEAENTFAKLRLILD